MSLVGSNNVFVVISRNAITGEIKSVKVYDKQLFHMPENNSQTNTSVEIYEAPFHTSKMDEPLKLPKSVYENPYEVYVRRNDPNIPFGSGL